MRHNYHRNLKCSQTTFKCLLVIRRRRRCKNKTILGKTLCFLFCFMLWIVLCLHLVNKPHSSEIFLFSLKFCFHLEVSFVKTVLLELNLERKSLVNCVMCRNLCCWGLVYLAVRPARLQLLLCQMLVQSEPQDCAGLTSCFLFDCGAVREQI